jgi:hypothetical protein
LTRIIAYTPTVPARTPASGPVLRGLLHPAWGPLLRVGLRSAEGATTEGLAIIDTGASMSAVDRSTARSLGLPTHGAATWFAVSSTNPGAREAAPLRRGQLRLGDDPRFWELDLIEVPGLHDQVQGFRAIALLGWDFLQNAQLQIDGPAGTWSLGLPPLQTRRRRR